LNKNKKRLILFITSVFLLSLASVSYAKDINKTFFNFKVPQNATEEKIEKEVDTKMVEFKQKVDDDIFNTFNLPSEEYEAIDVNMLLDDGSIEYNALKDLLISICVEQKVGDILPSIYLSKENRNEGYICEKKNDGTNIIYTIKRETNDKINANDTNDTKWVIENTEKKSGESLNEF